VIRARSIEWSRYRCRCQVFRRFVREQLDAWGKLIRAAKIQPE